MRPRIPKNCDYSRADIGFTYAFWQVDTALQYARKAVSLARQMQYSKEVKRPPCLPMVGALWAAGDYDKAVEASFKSLNLFKSLEDYVKMDDFLICRTGRFFTGTPDDYGQALKYGRLSLNLYDSLISTHEMNRKPPGAAARIRLPL